MRKFKIKNRRKRKYVKKNDVAHSFSQVQTLTIGIVPLAIMAIAFLTTTVMYSPALSSIHLPTIRFSAPSITLPEISFSWPKVTLPEIPKITIAQPELPKVSAPKIELPKMELPKIVLPNPSSYIAALGNAVIQALGQFFQALFQGVSSLSISIGNGIMITATTLGQALVQMATITGRFIAQLFISIGIGIAQVFEWTVSSIISIGRLLQQWTVQAITTLGIWIQMAISATINAWNAFVWWLGTPFRAIGKATNEFLILISPVTNYLAQSMQHASEDLSMGGNALVEGANYVSQSMEENSAKNK